MIKFILTALVMIKTPTGYEVEALRAEFKTALTCEQARQFSVEEINKTRDGMVLSAQCAKILEV